MTKKAKIEEYFGSQRKLADEMIIQISKHLGTTTPSGEQSPAKVERQEGESTKGEVGYRWPATVPKETTKLTVTNF